MEETKSKRSNILFTPSVYEDLRILSVIFDTSVNDILHELAKKYIEQNRKLVELFKERQEINTIIVNRFSTMTDEERIELGNRLNAVEQEFKKIADELEMKEGTDHD